MVRPFFSVIPPLPLLHLHLRPLYLPEWAGAWAWPEWKGLVSRAEAMCTPTTGGSIFSEINDVIQHKVSNNIETLPYGHKINYKYSFVQCTRPETQLIYKDF